MEYGVTQGDFWEGFADLLRQTGVEFLAFVHTDPVSDPRLHLQNLFYIIMDFIIICVIHFLYLRTKITTNHNLI